MSCCATPALPKYYRYSISSLYMNYLCVAMQKCCQLLRRRKWWMYALLQWQLQLQQVYKDKLHQSKTILQKRDSGQLTV